MLDGGWWNADAYEGVLIGKQWPFEVVMMGNCGRNSVHRILCKLFMVEFLEKSVYFQLLDVSWVT